MKRDIIKRALLGVRLVLDFFLCCFKGDRTVRFMRNLTVSL